MVVVDFMETADSDEHRKQTLHRIHRIHQLLEAAAYTVEALAQLHRFPDLAEKTAKQLARIQRRYQYESELHNRECAESKVRSISEKLAVEV